MFATTHRSGMLKGIRRSPDPPTAGAGRRFTLVTPFALCVRALLAMIVAVALVACGPIRADAQGAGAGDPIQVKAHVKEILGQPEFQPEPSDSPMAKLGRALREQWESGSHWLESRWKAIQNWLRRLFSGVPVGAAAAIANVFSYVFVAIALGFGGWLIAWLIRTLWIRRRRDRTAKARTAYDEAEEDEGVVPEPGAWIEQASVYAGADDYRRAFRAVFVATLLLLDQGGLIEFDRARTNGDYLRLLRHKNVRRLFDILDPLVREFDRRWYGRAETAKEDYLRIQQTFERVRTLMAEPAPAGTPAAVSGKV
jgi:hypothetical protein